MRSARPMSLVHTAAARPKRTSLAMRSASSSSLKRMIDSTGPKTSSCAMRMSLRTPVKMVGCTNQPCRIRARRRVAPPSTAVAPSLRAMSMYSSTFLNCGGVVTGPDLRVQVHRVAHAGRARDGEQLLDERVVDAVLHQQARAGDAGLPGRREDAGDRAEHRLLEVGVVEHDVGRLAAQLHRGVLEVPRRLLVDEPAGRVGAGEADLAHQRMLDQRRAHLGAEAGDDVEHAGRETRPRRTARRTRASMRK